jgi:predicted nuclease of predicted toxin-antitoxin system
MRLLADEDFPLPTVLRLRELGHDVLTALEAGIANDETGDDEVLSLASRLERVILTHNRRHFRRLHRTRPEHAGLILCTRDPDFVRLAQRIHSQISAIQSLAGQLIRVVRPDRVQ